METALVAEPESPMKNRLIKPGAYVHVKRKIHKSRYDGSDVAIGPYNGYVVGPTKTTAPGEWWTIRIDHNLSLHSVEAEQITVKRNPPEKRPERR